MPQEPDGPPPPWPGEFGWLRVAYTGKAPGVRPWRGQVTGLVYWFGQDRTTGYVDARDGVKFLTPRRTNGATAVFRVME